MISLLYQTFWILAAAIRVASKESILLKNLLISNIVKNGIPVTKKDALKCP
jgi:hypothetical protein